MIFWELNSAKRINRRNNIFFQRWQYPNINVKISKKYLPQTCSRSARVWWLRSIFSISLPWQKRWRYRQLQDRNRSWVWLNFINNRSRLPLQWFSPVPSNYLSKKSMLGLFTRVTNKQGCMSSNNYIKLIYKLNRTILWPEALLIHWNNT